MTSVDYRGRGGFFVTLQLLVGGAVGESFNTFRIDYDNGNHINCIAARSFPVRRQQRDAAKTITKKQYDDRVTFSKNVTTSVELPKRRQTDDENTRHVLSSLTESGIVERFRKKPSNKLFVSTRRFFVFRSFAHHLYPTHVSSSRIVNRPHPPYAKRPQTT